LGESAQLNQGRRNIEWEISRWNFHGNGVGLFPLEERWIL